MQAFILTSNKSFTHLIVKLDFPTSVVCLKTHYMFLSAGEKTCWPVMQFQSFGKYKTLSSLASTVLYQEVEWAAETASNGAKTQPWPYITFPWRPDDFQLWWTTQIQPNFSPDKWRASILNMISCFLHSALLRTIYQGYLGVSYPPYIVSRIYLLFLCSELESDVFMPRNFNFPALGFSQKYVGWICEILFSEICYDCRVYGTTYARRACSRVLLTSTCTKWRKYENF